VPVIRLSLSPPRFPFSHNVISKAFISLRPKLHKLSRVVLDRMNNQRPNVHLPLFYYSLLITILFYMDVSSVSFALFKRRHTRISSLSHQLNQKEYSISVVRPLKHSQPLPPSPPLLYTYIPPNINSFLLCHKITQQPTEPCVCMCMFLLFLWTWVMKRIRIGRGEKRIESQSESPHLDKYSTNS